MSESVSTKDEASKEADRSATEGKVRRSVWLNFYLMAILMHVPVFVYPILRLAHWLDLNALMTLLILVPLTGSQILSRAFLRDRNQVWAILLRRASDLWLGMSALVLCSLMFFEILVFADLVSGRNAAISVISISSLVALLGTLNALTPSVVVVKFKAPELKSPVRFVQISDVHIGSRSRRFLEKVIFKVNSLNPDFLCITGDFIDAAGIEEETLVSLKSVAGPVYYCTGNHEKYEDFEDIMIRLDNLGVVVLRDACLHHREDLQVIGIDDMEDAMQVQRQLGRLEIDPKAFNLVLFHRPRGLEAAASAGVNLIISGHTHNGQIYPFNFLVSRVFDRIKGMYQIGNARQYVNEGTGTWGPIMRVGTRSEITLFELTPE
jgi:predicted MPP superfamily phosphohydrolase